MALRNVKGLGESPSWNLKIPAGLGETDFATDSTSKLCCLSAFRQHLQAMVFIAAQSWVLLTSEQEKSSYSSGITSGWYVSSFLVCDQRPCSSAGKPTYSTVHNLKEACMQWALYVYIWCGGHWSVKNIVKPLACTIHHPNTSSELIFYNGGGALNSRQLLSRYLTLVTVISLLISQAPPRKFRLSQIPEIIPGHESIGGRLSLSFPIQDQRREAGMTSLNVWELIYGRQRVGVHTAPSRRSPGLFFCGSWAGGWCCAAPAWHWRCHRTLSGTTYSERTPGSAVKRWLASWQMVISE